MQNFKADLQWSNEISKQLDTWYDQTFDEHKFIEDVEFQKKFDIDRVVRVKDRVFGIEEKIVRKVYDCIYIEEMSCPATNKKGWIYTSAADRLLWVFCGSNMLHLFEIDMKKLRHWFKTVDKTNYRRHQNKEYNMSTGRLVPIKDIQDFIISTTSLPRA